MFNLKAIFTRALLALTLSLGAGAALAGPTYHVVLDTTTLDGRSGYLNLVFIGTGDAAPATATSTNFAGNFGAGTLLDGNPGASVILDNTGPVNEFLQFVNFGGLFSFDVRFDMGSGDDGTTFGLALINEAFDDYLGGSGNIAEISVQPGVADVLTADNTLVSISVAAEVPEPGAWLLMALGLMLMAYTLQRRAAR